MRLLKQTFNFNHIEMKRLAIALLMVTAVSAVAQKQPKPNLNKALGALKEGKIAEAKTIIDAATTYEKTMNDGKTYYYKGLIYFAIDTSSNPDVNGLDANAFTTALEAMDKAESMAGKNEYTIPGPDVLNTITKPMQMAEFANYYLNKGLKKLQNDQDGEGSLANVVKTEKIFTTHAKAYNNDTLTYMLGAYAASQAEKSDKLEYYSNKYAELKGTDRNVYLLAYQDYLQSENVDKALAILRKGREVLPNDKEMALGEMQLLINSGKSDEAKAGIQKAIQQDPNNKLLHYYLGIVAFRLNQYEEARTAFSKSIELDPAFFDAYSQLASVYAVEVDNINKEIKDTPDTKANSAKRSQLVQKRTKAAETAIPYFERAEKVKAPDTEALVDLLTRLDLLYYYVADDKNSERVKKKLKMLGVEE